MGLPLTTVGSVGAWGNQELGCGLNSFDGLVEEVEMWGTQPHI